MITVRVNPEGVVLPIRVTPRANRSEFLPYNAELSYLTVRLNAQPIDGQANAALIVYVAEVLKLPKSAVSIAKGGQSRLKQVHIQTQQPKSLMVQLAQIVQTDMETAFVLNAQPD